MPRLNQIIAIATGEANRSKTRVTEVYHKLKKAELFTGHTRKYQPKNDDPNTVFGEVLPSEVKHVTASTRELLKEAQDYLNPAFNIDFVRESANATACADVVVDGQVIIPKAPVTFLLSLEKRAEDMVALANSLPQLDSSERWTFNPATGQYETEPAQSARTKKVTRALVLYEATKEHPAQVKETSEDVQVGTWTTVKQSTALSVSEKREFVTRAEKFLKAVKSAREEANSIEVPKVEGPADKIFNYVFGG